MTSRYFRPRSPIGVYVLALVWMVPASGAASHVDRVSTAALKVKHVFMIVLENKSFTDTFGGSTQDPYLKNTLRPMGALLTEYFGTGHVSLDNYIALVSGQASTPDTANDCLPGLTGSSGNYNDVDEIGVTEDGQVIAQRGCIYRTHVKTLADQLIEVGLTWKAYMEDMGNDRAREAQRCGHPPIGIGTDNTNEAEAPSREVPRGDAYATRHNPFMYFHSIIDSVGCQENVVNLDKLSDDLERKSTTANFIFITPNLCHDGHDGGGTGAPGTTCVNGEPGGLASGDAFLHTWVPRILASPAYKENGLLIITFDEGNYTVSEAKDESTGRRMVEIIFPGEACCMQRPGPNLRDFRPGTITVVNTSSLIQRVTVNGYGGDRIGALLLSPFVRPGSTSGIPYNHYSLLRTLEDIFGLPEHLGYAADNPREGYRVDNIGNDGNIFEQH